MGAHSTQPNIPGTLLFAETLQLDWIKIPRFLRINTPDSTYSCVRQDGLDVVKLPGSVACSFDAWVER